MQTERVTPHRAGIYETVSLADKNWFRTGGAARYYSEPQTAHEFQTALSHALQHQCPVFVLGEGANILVSDEGFDGLVIKPALLTIEQCGQDTLHIFLRAGAGVSMGALIDYCLENNLIGLEEFSGIPGTVGGSVFINIHYFEFLLSHFLTEATVIHARTGEVMTVNNQWFRFAYNYSALHDQPYYLLDAVFKLKKVSALEASYARGRQKEIIRHRQNRYPTARTCGSFFRNFHQDELKERMVPYVAYYFDKLGIKGALTVGSASVSHRHANMIVSTEGGNSNDIVELARHMQALVKKEFGLVPQPECRFVGFKAHPLLL